MSISVSKFIALLSSMVTVCLFSVSVNHLRFSRFYLYHFIPTSNKWGGCMSKACFFTSFTTLVTVHILITAILVGVKCYLTVALFHISLMSKDVQHLCIFSWAYWLFVYLLWNNVYSDPLPIFKWGYFFFVIFFVELLLRCNSSFYILDTRPLSDMIWK